MAAHGGTRRATPPFLMLMLFTASRMSLIRRWSGFLWPCIALLMAQTAQAACSRAEYLNPRNDQNTIKLRFGHINLTDTALQPYGLLASLAVSATHYPAANKPNPVLWRCDASDLGNLRFLVATHADWEFGGMNDLGKLGEPAGVYLTAFRNIGLRLRMDGKPLTDHWQAIPVKSYRKYKAGDREMIAIHLQDIPVMEAELYKVNWRVPERDDIVGCHYKDRQGTRISYDCADFNGYLQLAGPGIPHDLENELADSRHSLAYRDNNALAWGMYHSLSLSRVPTCVVNSATPHVHFGTVTMPQLDAAGMAGAAAADFNIEVKCNDALTKVSGTKDNQTAIGLQVSPSAFAAAKALNLVNASNGVKLLVSDQYGMPGFAQGVGIALHSRGGGRRYFVGQPGLVGPGWPRDEINRNNSGWYPVGNSPGAETCQTTQFRCYRLDFTAKLMKLPGVGVSVTPGKVRATAHVLVKVQ